MLPLHRKTEKKAVSFASQMCIALEKCVPNGHGIAHQVFKAKT